MVYSRTLTAVYDALLEDIVYPVEIVGKRIRVKLDGSQVIKVHLDKNEQTNIEHKVLIHFLEEEKLIFTYYIYTHILYVHKLFFIIYIYI